MELPDYAVKADNIVKRFGEQLAVNGLSFTVKERECYGLLGPNGAGKTTTLRMVHCFYPLTSGEISVFGLDVNKDCRVDFAVFSVMVSRWLECGLEPEQACRWKPE